MMYILGVDTTGAVMSAALFDGERVCGEVFGDASKKHLQTLMPCVKKLLFENNVDISQVDAFAVSIGPGSFTGIRIGAAAVAAMAQATEKPVMQVCTLEALSRNVSFDGLVCPMIDARRSEVFYAVYEYGVCKVLPCAGPVRDVIAELAGEKVIFVGDGAEAYKDIIQTSDMIFSFAGESVMTQRAASVCRAAYDMYMRGELSSPEDISPRYLRLSQAERVKKESGG